MHAVISDKTKQNWLKNKPMKLINCVAFSFCGYIQCVNVKKTITVDKKNLKSNNDQLNNCNTLSMWFIFMLYICKMFRVYFVITCM